MKKAYSEGKRSDHNINPLLYPKLWRRIMYERCESEVDIGGNRGASHVSDGDVVILKVFQWGTRMRRGMGVRVTVMDMGVLGNHSSSA